MVFLQISGCLITLWQTNMAIGKHVHLSKKRTYTSSFPGPFFLANYVDLPECDLMSLILFVVKELECQLLALRQIYMLGNT